MLKQLWGSPCVQFRFRVGSVIWNPALYCWLPSVGKQFFLSFVLGAVCLWEGEVPSRMKVGVPFALLLSCSPTLMFGYPRTNEVWDARGPSRFLPYPSLYSVSQISAWGCFFPFKEHSTLLGGGGNRRAGWLNAVWFDLVILSYFVGGRGCFIAFSFCWDKVSLFSPDWKLTKQLRLALNTHSNAPASASPMLGLQV